MADEERSRERAFKVEDRRRFSDTGDARPGQADAPAPSTDAAAEPEKVREPATQVETRPEIDFSTFVISLSAQALAHLGEIPDPVQHAVRVDLDAARQVIDILGMLREKTKGNLDSAEDPLLKNILYDLRMKYVERIRDR
jgi:hypothetical protein